jgi:hypothetical protein
MIKQPERCPNCLTEGSVCYGSVNAEYVCDECGWDITKFGKVTNEGESLPPMGKTTLLEIYKNHPCCSGFKILVYALYPNIGTDDDFKDIRRLHGVYRLLSQSQLERPISTKFILKNNGVIDTCWLMRIFANTPDWWRLKADIVETIFDVYKLKYPNGYERLKVVIENVRSFADGKISEDELKLYINDPSVVVYSSEFLPPYNLIKYDVLDTVTAIRDCFDEDKPLQPLLDDVERILLTYIF